MLYGAMLKENRWVVKKYIDLLCICFEMDPNMYRKIPAQTFLRKLSVDSKFNGREKIYVFSYGGEGRFAFVTHEDVDFSSINRPENRKDSEPALIVEGALYDFKKEQFVKFDPAVKKTSFYEFVIYDSGIPNIIYQRNQYKYRIGYLKGNTWKFYDTCAYADPQMVSCVSMLDRYLEKRLNRCIFFLDTEGNGKMVALEHEICFSCEVTGVEFEDICYSFDKRASENDYYYQLNGRNTAPKPVNEIGFFTIKHLFNDDAIIVKDVISGDSKIMYINSPMKVDDFLFFAYSKTYSHEHVGHNMLKVEYRMNDFDNGKGTMDLTDRKFV